MLEGLPGREILEEDMSLQGHETESQHGDGLDPPHGDQQEPAEGQAHVHVTQQRIDTEDPAVEQRLADDFADGSQRGTGRNSAPYQPFVGLRQAVEPQSVLDGQRREEDRRAEDERQTERIVEGHG